LAVQEIDVYIDKTGQVRLEVRGIAGGACLTVTAPLEKALGGEVIAREMTSEAQGQEQTDETHQQHGA
jgi:hypothetical protein